MPRNAKRSADAQLDQLRQAVAAERVKARDLETQLEAARLEVEGAARAVTDAYAEDDAKLAGLRRQELQAAEGDVANLGNRAGAAGLPVERAQQELDAFQREHARDLLEEREQPARTVAAELTASVHETLRLAMA